MKTPTHPLGSRFAVVVVEDNGEATVHVYANPDLAIDQLSRLSKDKYPTMRATIVIVGYTDNGVKVAGMEYPIDPPPLRQVRLGEGPIQDGVIQPT